MKTQIMQFLSNLHSKHKCYTKKLIQPNGEYKDGGIQYRTLSTDESGKSFFFDSKSTDTKEKIDVPDELKKFGSIKVSTFNQYRKSNQPIATYFINLTNCGQELRESNDLDNFSQINEISRQALNKYLRFIIMGIIFLLFAGIITPYIVFASDINYHENKE